MQPEKRKFCAIAKNVRFSPYKLRPLVDVVRGKSVQEALSWLATCPLKRALPIRKVIKSASDNANHLENIGALALMVSEIRVDLGRTYSYLKPGAMGRSSVLKRRFSSISVIVQSQDTKKA